MKNSWLNENNTANMASICDDDPLWHNLVSFYLIIGKL